MRSNRLAKVRLDPAHFLARLISPVTWSLLTATFFFSMATLSETLRLGKANVEKARLQKKAKTEAAASGGAAQSSQPADKRKSPDESGGGTDNKDSGSTFNLLLADHLALRNDFARIQKSKEIVVIWRNAEAIETLQLLWQAYLDTKPTRSKEDLKKPKNQREPLPPHPNGTKQYYCLGLLCDHLIQLAENKMVDSTPLPENDQKAYNALKILINTKSEEAAISLGACGPQYNKPKGDRPWVWTIDFTDFAAHETFMMLFAALIENDWKGYCTIAFHHAAQTQTTQKLWSRRTGKG